MGQPNLLLIEEKRRIAADERIRFGLSKTREEAIKYVFDFPEDKLDRIVEGYHEYLKVEAFKTGLFLFEIGSGKTKREVIKEKISEIHDFSSSGVTIFLGEDLDEIL